MIVFEIYNPNPQSEPIVGGRPPPAFSKSSCLQLLLSRILYTFFWGTLSSPFPVNLSPWLPFVSILRL